MDFPVAPLGTSFGARIAGVDLAQLRQADEFAALDRLLARYGLLSVPAQHLSEADLGRVSQAFGPLDVFFQARYRSPTAPEIIVLSNRVVDGQPIGLGDAGQDWHTDATYNPVPARALLLYALEIPEAGGRRLGDTEFADMYAAYDALPVELKQRLDGRFAIHDYEKFWNYMIDVKGSPRPRLTDEEIKQRPPVYHPIVMRHPVSGRKLLYANFGNTRRIIGFSRRESDETLEFLFAHQVKPEFCFRYTWSAGDVVVCDNLATVHRAIGDYGPGQHRHLLRTQIRIDPAIHPGFEYTDNNTLAASAADPPRSSY
jgi:taurine dioxygenase